MAFNYDPSKYRANQLLSSLIACSGLQYMSLFIGLWWLAIAAGVTMVFVYYKPDLLPWRGEVKTAIIATQIPNVLFGVASYYTSDINTKRAIILILLVYSLMFPLRILIRVNSKVNAERKRLTGSIW